MHEETKQALARAAKQADAFLNGLADRPVRAEADFASVKDDLEGTLPNKGLEPAAVIDELAERAGPGIVASAGPRYFGFVTGGSLPAALAADWLVSAWDQNVALNAMSPAAAAIEAITADWIVDLLGLPKQASVGFTTGCTMANLVGLAAGRNALLLETGWDVEAKGLYGAPEITVIVGDEAHASLYAALQMLGLGRERVVRVAVDDQGRMAADGLIKAIEVVHGPILVCAQAGNVNTGAFDPMRPIGEACRARGAWLHIDGAFGIWAAAAPERRHLADGLALADSWATDAHKWLNVPYDGGIAVVANEAAHRAAMTTTGAYLVRGEAGERDGLEYTPDSSRRARGIPVYAALRSLGREGLADLIERNCRQARNLAGRLSRETGIEILNDVVLNQALVRFLHPTWADDEASDALTRSVVAAVQEEGTAWLGGTVWQGEAAMRVSVSNWSTGEDDIERTADAILACYRRLRDEADQNSAG